MAYARRLDAHLASSIAQEAFLRVWEAAKDGEASAAGIPDVELIHRHNLALLDSEKLVNQSAVSG